MALVCRIPDQGKHAIVILAGGATEIGVELARTEFGRCERQAHIFLAAALATADPACPDLNALGQDDDSVFALIWNPVD